MATQPQDPGPALPDPPQDLGSTSADRPEPPGRALAGFLHAHRIFLDSVIGHRQWFGRKQQAQIARAWAEASASLLAAAEEIADKPDSELARAGLTGEQLGLKLDSWRRELHPIGSRLRRGWARRTLKAANIIVGSVASVVGIAEPVKELGEVIVDAIERRAGRG